MLRRILNFLNLSSLFPLSFSEFMHAVARNDIDRIKAYLQENQHLPENLNQVADKNIAGRYSYGDDYYYQINEGDHALLQASRHGQGISPTLSLLLQFDIDVDYADPAGNTALMLAVWSGDHALKAVMNLLNHGAHIGLCNAQGDNVLHSLMKSPMSEISALLKIFLLFKVNPNLANHHGETPLMLACKRDNKSQKKNIRLILLESVDVNRADKQGMTALMYACQNHDVNLEMVSLLLKAGAAVNAVDHQANTALHYASVRDKPEIIRLLISAGAKVDAPNQHGNTPLTLNAQHTLTGDYERFEILSVLLENNAQVNAANESGETALMFAAKNGNKNTLSALLEHGAHPNLVDCDGNSALFLALQAENFLHNAIIKSSGENVNYPSSIGDQPTGYAEDRSALSEVTLNVIRLLDAGANLDLKNKNGETFKSFASHNTLTLILEYLITPPNINSVIEVAEKLSTEVITIDCSAFRHQFTFFAEPAGTFIGLDAIALSDPQSPTLSC